MTYKALAKPNSDNVQVQEYVSAAQRGLKSQFVTKSEKGWNVRRAGAQKASGIFSVKADAVRHATAIAKNQKTEVYIFDAEGKLLDRKSY